MNAAAFRFLLLGLFALCAACSSTQPPPDDLLPPQADRQAELTRLFDRFAGPELPARAAAAEAAKANDRDRRFLASLWGTRSSAPLCARRYADALSSAAKHTEAFDWYQRAFMQTAARDASRHELRYEMAEEYYALGRHQDCIALLANRLSLEPLPAALRVKYDALQEAAAKAAR